jgi:DNA-binding NarL/FixJ family response regulator
LIKVVIAEDHHLVREGTRALLDKSGDIQVIGEAENGKDAIRIVRQTRPDVLVMDIAMPNLNGIQALAELKRLGIHIPVVILSMYSNDALVQEALSNGARGYVLKDSLSEDLLLAIRAAKRGATYLSPPISDTAFSIFWSRMPRLEEKHLLERPLTQRESEVLGLISEGYTNNRIAKKLQISTKTVERHRAKLMAKLDAHNLVGLIRKAFKYGLISLED